MFMPLTTDAQVRFWPVATVVMIVVHVLIYAVTANLPAIPLEIDWNALETDSSEIDPADLRALQSLLSDQPGWVPYALSHGDGLHPLQWVTSMLIHAHLAHLLGNMLFLWVFGLFVEGMAGPGKFLGLYFGIGILQNIIEQILFLPFPNAPSLGASSAIFGLMMIAVLWCPQDHVQCFYLIFFRPGMVDIPTLLMGSFYFLSDVVFASLEGFRLGTSLLHVMGGALGLVAGFVMLRQGWVDADDRDVLSLLRGDHPKRKSRQQIKRDEASAAAAKADITQQLEIAWRSFDQHLAAGNVETVMRQLNRIQQVAHQVRWTEPRLRGWINLLMKNNQYQRVLRYAEEYTARFPERADGVRLVQAQILAERMGFPRRSLKILQQIDSEKLNPRQRSAFAQTAARVKRQIDAGDLEPEAEP